MKCQPVLIKLLLLATILNLFGCGFHRVKYGKNPLPICVEGKDKAKIDEYLNLVCNKKSYILNIKSSSISSMSLSNSANNNVKQYQESYYIVFDLLDKKRKPIKNNQHLSINKPLTINSNYILSSKNERNILRNEMMEDLMERLNLRLHYIVSSLK